MDFNSPLTIVSMFMLCALCRAIILVKFSQLSHYFTASRMRARHEPDPLINFGLISRQLLCDAVIEAKQFSALYHPAYYKTVTGGNVPMVARTNPSTSGDNILNYQRSLVAHQNANSSPLVYQSRPLRFGKNSIEQVKALQCVNTKNVKWYIAYGYIDHLMYLLEKHTSERDARLRISGLFEPTPVTRNRPVKYFSDQFESSREDMEKICTLGLNDHLRLCGALLDALNNEGSLDRSVPQMNFVRCKLRICVNKTIELVRKKANVLRCIFLSEEKGEVWMPFYTLNDVQEPGAVFVFFENKEGNLYLHARMIRVTALMSPVGARRRTVRANKDQCKDGSDPGKKKKQWDDPGDDDDDDEMDMDDTAVQDRGVEMNPRELDQAENSNEDTDHEDYIIDLPSTGGDEGEQEEKSLSRTPSKAEDTRKIKRKSRDSMTVSLPKKSWDDPSVSYLAKLKDTRKGKEVDEDSGGGGTSDDYSGRKLKAKKKSELLFEKKENTEGRTYVTRYRERKKLRVQPGTETLDSGETALSENEEILQNEVAEFLEQLKQRKSTNDRAEKRKEINKSE